MKRNNLLLGFAAILYASASALHAMPFADSVVHFTHGIDYGVDDESRGTYKGKSGEGESDPLAVTALDGAVLGLGWGIETQGTITMRFTTGEVIDGAGPDLRLYDTFSFADGVSVGVSADGLNFLPAGSFAGNLGIFNCGISAPAAPCITDVDISATGLNAISYLQITTAGSSGQGFPGGYTLDAAEALNFRAFPVSEPGTLALLGAAFGALAVMRRRNQTNGIVAEQR